MTEENKPAPPNFTATISLGLDDTEMRADINYSVEADGAWKPSYARVQMSRDWYNSIARNASAPGMYAQAIDTLRAIFQQVVLHAEEPGDFDNTDDLFSYEGENGVVRIEDTSWSLEELKAFIEAKLATDRASTERFFDIVEETFHLDPEPDERLEAFLYEARCRREDLLKAH